MRLRDYTVHIAKRLKSSYALHKIFKLKKRYILTKQNNVRVRYAVLAILVLGCVELTAFSSLPHLMGFRTIGQTLQSNEKIQALETASMNHIQSYVSEGMRKAQQAIIAAPKPAPLKLDRVLTLGKGQTIAGILQKEGVSGEDSYKITRALGKHFDLRKARAGQNIDLHFKRLSDDTLDFSKMSMRISAIKDVEIGKNRDGEISADLTEKKLKDRKYARSATIQNSLYGSAMKAGIPESVIANVMKTYSWNIDFQRDIRSGDKIEVLYEAKETDDGEYRKTGNVLYANLNIHGRDIKIYRHKLKDGRVEYFEEDGMSIKKTLMKTPIDGARMSSGFGMRKHPVLGYNKMHKGVDFAASTGTPIYAAGDGVVTFKGRKGGYGNYISIRHNGKLSTAYAHMHKFAKGMSNGKRVRQGQVIGYVGSTGRSTGPHLHYEVLVHGKHVNPNSVDLPTGEQLAGAELKRFKELVRNVKRDFVNLGDGMEVAEKPITDKAKSSL